MHRPGHSRLSLSLVLGAALVGGLAPGLPGLPAATPAAAQATVPAAASSLFAEGAVLQKNGRHAEAVEKFLAGLEIAPQAGTAHFFIAASYVALGEKQKAQQHYQKAVEFAASDIDRDMAAARLRELQEPPQGGVSSRPAATLTPGRGVLTTPQGDRYEGDIVAGRRTGRGVQVYANNDRYDGEWLNDQLHGRGLLVYAAGGRYDGEWRNGQMHGRGLRVWPDNGRYDGDWVEGRLHGRGLLIFPDGSRYDGDWDNNKRSGRGLRIWPDLSRYEGEWTDDKPNGTGTLTLKDGPLTGTWKNGCLQGGRRAAAGVPTRDCGY